MFSNETGIDYGALTRDWLVKLAEALSQPELALFTVVSSAKLTHPSPASHIQPNYLGYFRLFGRCLAKAFINDVPLTVRLSKLVLKTLLKREQCSLADLQGFDAEMHRGLVWMLENDITGVIDETFSTTVSVLGKVDTINLKENGESIAVTQENKEEFVDLKAKAVMMHGIRDQMQAVFEGFSEMIPPKNLKDFSVTDLHVAISGISSISVHDWRKNTEITAEWQNHKHVIDMFWQIVGQELTPEQRSKLLYFATASASPPPGGFANLHPNKFRISALVDGPPGSLPIAHACFCNLVLPLDIGDDYEAFRQKLLMAVSESDGFEIA